MANKRKRKRRRVSAEELRETMAPTKDFDWENPYNEDELIVVTAQRLSPGHLFNMDSTSLIRAYRQDELNKKKPPVAEENDEESDTINNLENILNNLGYAAEIASISIVDPKTHTNIYSKDDCLKYIPAEKITEIATWAVENARPIKEGEDADDVDRFPGRGEKQEEPSVEEQTK